MSNLIPVKGNSDLVRDPNTDQIINTIEMPINNMLIVVKNVNLRKKNL